VHNLTRDEASHQDCPNNEDNPEHLVLILSALAPVINQNDANTVETVEEDCSNQADFSHSDDVGLIGLDYGVIGLYADADQSGVQDVYK